MQKEILHNTLPPVFLVASDGLNCTCNNANWRSQVETLILQQLNVWKSQYWDNKVFKILTRHKFHLHLSYLTSNIINSCCLTMHDIGWSFNAMFKILLVYLTFRLFICLFFHFSCLSSPKVYIFLFLVLFCLFPSNNLSSFLYL